MNNSYSIFTKWNIKRHEDYIWEPKQQLKKMKKNHYNQRQNEFSFKKKNNFAYLISFI